MKHIATVLAGACAFICTTASAENLIHIANNGVDSGACGAATEPCRSISQGIANALPGDTLLVRPGKYGDNDGSGFIDRLGEESGGSLPGSTAGVHVSKALTIVSTEGAEATIIDMGNVTAAVVEIVASGVKFGEPGGGFTLTGAQSMGLATGNVTDVVISGNTATRLPFAGFYLPSSGVVEARGNKSIDNAGVGILAMTYSGSGYVVATNNFVTGNHDGIVVGSIASHRIVGNRILGNNAGLQVNYGTSRITGNYVSGNRVGASINGFSNDVTLPRGPQLTRNHFVGNRANGVDVFSGPPGILPVLRENNIFGNGNCGVTHLSETLQLDARNNFWGAATGPSFNEPADPTCGVYQPVRSTPFATSEFAIR
jgi:hypothetical protein